MKQSFWIEGRLPGLNEVIDANRRNRYKGAKLKADTETLIMAAIRERNLRPVKGPAHIKCVWVETSRRRDKDNISSARKFILDALVNAGILSGDGWRYVEGFTDVFDVAKRPGVAVEIETPDYAEGAS